MTDRNEIERIAAIIELKLGVPWQEAEPAAKAIAEELAAPAPEAHEGCGACGDGCSGGPCRLACESPETDDDVLGVEALAQEIRRIDERCGLLAPEALAEALWPFVTRLATPPVAADGVESTLRRAADMLDGFEKALVRYAPIADIEEWPYHPEITDVAENLRRLASAQQDDESADGTPAAHPAYWRGESRGVEGACMRIADVLDGKDSGDGTLGHPSLEVLRRRLLSVRQPSAPAAVLTDEEADRIADGVLGVEAAALYLPLLGIHPTRRRMIVRAFAQVLSAQQPASAKGDPDA